MNLQISCTLCSKPFSADNPPRIAKKCPHTYCESCIRTSESCPMDKIPFEFSKSGLEGFHINRTIVKMLKLNLLGPTTPAPLIGGSMTPKPERKKSSQKRLTPSKPEIPRTKTEQSIAEAPVHEADESNKCLLHNKDLDLVCLDHAVKVCSNCALFGQHKNHSVKPIQTLIGECACVAQQTLAILGEIKSHQETINETHIRDHIDQCLKGRREDIVKNMRVAFTKIIDKLRKQERSLIGQLDKLIQTTKEELFAKTRLDECSKRKDSWVHDAKQLLRVIDSFPSYSKVEEATSYLNPQKSEGSLVQRGGYVLVQLEMFDKIFQEKLATTIADITLETSPSMETQAENWFSVYRLSDKQGRVWSHSTSPHLGSDKNPKQKNEEDQLLQQLNQFPKELQNQYNGGYGFSNTTFFNTTSSGSTSVQMNLANEFGKSQYLDPFSSCQLDSSNQSQLVSRLHTQSQYKSVNSKKGKKVKVPEKYEPMLQDLANDKCDCIDFTNAQLGDSVVLGLCEYIHGTVKVKTLKLIRCKLTDDVMQSLLGACRDSRIASLNLGQNLLTEETLDLMSKVDLGDIKSITLSQNKINQRNSKNRIVEMKHRGIVLSI